MTRDRRAWLAGVAIALAVFSLALNLHLLAKVRHAEQALLPFLPLLEQVSTSEGQARLEVRLPAGTPINLDIPLDERVTIRVDTLLSIDARVVVPLRSPLGNYDIPVPIRGSLPLRGDLPVHLRHTFELRTETAESIVIPLDLGR